MKRLLVFLGALACGLALAATPNGLTNRNVARIAKSLLAATTGGGGGGSLLVNENFEGTGTPTGFTTLIGTPDYHNTTSPINGSKDLLLPSLSETDLHVVFTASNETWIQLTFKRGSSAPQLIVYVEAGAQYVGVSIGSGGGLQLSQGGTNVGSETADPFPVVGTPADVWLHVKNGSGANAVYDVEFGNGTRTGSGTKFTSYSAGTITNQFVDVEAYHPAALSGATQYDDMQISNTGWPP